MHMNSKNMGVYMGMMDAQFKREATTSRGGSGAGRSPGRFKCVFNVSCLRQCGRQVEVLLFSEFWGMPEIFH